MAPNIDCFCLNCGDYHFDLADAKGTQLKEGGVDGQPRRGKYYFDVTCKVCNQQQGLVIRPEYGGALTIWPCSWNDEPCMEDECEYCEGEYI